MASELSRSVFENFDQNSSFIRRATNLGDQITNIETSSQSDKSAKLIEVSDDEVFFDADHYEVS